MMFMLEGTATSMAVLLVMLASPSDPESDPETTLRWPFGTFNIDGSAKNDKISFKALLYHYKTQFSYLESLRRLMVGRVSAEVHSEVFRLKCLSK